jgi:hydrogenase maturation protease
MAATLIIGYGNTDRADDGVAYYVVNALRRSLGQRPLSDQETGLEDLCGGVDSVFVRQLVPELMETAADYPRVIFVDAHVFDDRPELLFTTVVPEYAPSPFTHHLTPSSFLALTAALYGRSPEGTIVSLRGRDFDFTRGLSPDTQTLVAPAVDRIRSLSDPGARQPSSFG